MKGNTELSSFDASKLLNPEMMRTNLLLSSLYLSAFEILKATVIEGVRKIVVYLPQPDENVFVALKNEMPANEFQALYDTNILAYRRLIEKYEKDIGVQFEQRDRFGLIPSCQWLSREGILSTQDIENIQHIRNHRNDIAHELPSLLISKGFDVDLDYLENIFIILKKVEPFFARIDADIPPDVSDESIMSGGQLILGLIWSTVTEHLQELSAES